MADPAIVIADSGPLIALSRADVIEVLQAVYGRVIVPRAVAHELAAGTNRPGARLLADHPWFELRALTLPVDALLSAELDAGEAEAISLAVELGKLPVLLDERRGRRIASAVYGLEVRRTLDVLVAAKHLGAIPAIAPIIQRMLSRGSYLSPKVIDRALRAVDEKD